MFISVIQGGEIENEIDLGGGCDCWEDFYYKGYRWSKEQYNFIVDMSKAHKVMDVPIEVDDLVKFVAFVKSTVCKGENK